MAANVQISLVNVIASDIDCRLLVQLSSCCATAVRLYDSLGLIISAVCGVVVLLLDAVAVLMWKLCAAAAGDEKTVAVGSSPTDRQLGQGVLSLSADLMHSQTNRKVCTSCLPH